MKRTLILVAVIVLALALLAPGLVGVLAQDQHERQIALTMQISPHIQLTAEEFERGWFSSHGRYRVELSDELQRAITRETAAEDPVEELPVLMIDSHLHHGPFALATALSEGGTLLPVLGTVVSELTLVSGDEMLFELPGAVITRIHLDGGGTARYASGPVERDEDGERVTWGGADVTVEFDAGATRIESEGRIEALTAVDNEGSFESAPITFSVEQTLTDYGFWTGESQLDVPDITYEGVTDEHLLLDGLRVHYSVQMPQRFVVASAEVSFAGLSVGDWMGGPAVLRFEISHLEPVALGRLITTLQDMSARAQPETSQTDSVMGEASDELSTLLANGAVFALEELRVQTPDGEVFVRLRLEFPEKANTGAENVFLLVGGLHGDLSLQLPKALVTAAGAAKPESQQYLQMLLETGFIHAQYEYYVVNAVYKGGLLTVNGIPVPIPFGGVLSPQAVE